MAPIVPNQFKVKGIIKAKNSNAGMEHFSNLVLTPEKIERLDGPAEFLDPATKKLTILANDTDVSELKVGMLIECRIRKTPDHFMIIPDSIQQLEKEATPS